MSITATKSRCKKFTTFQLPKISLSKTYSESERKHDEAVCLSRMNEKSITHAQLLKFCREKLYLEV
jgi:hypothetical protein